HLLGRTPPPDSWLGQAPALDSLPERHMEHIICVVVLLGLTGVSSPGPVQVLKA
ncbi:hypothetical protein P7K49_003443, partial [Saguinus oedipus]